MARVLVLGKLPPLQGGVAARTFSFVRQLAEKGHEVTVLTNSKSARSTYLEAFTAEDEGYFRAALKNVEVLSLNPEEIATHIPYSSAFETRLIGLGADAAATADLIIGWYFQPYGVVAAILAKLHNKPLVLMHAGSDLGRLSLNPEFHHAYRHLFSKALFVATRPANAVQIMKLFSVPESSVINAERTRLVPSYFLSKSRTLPITALIDSYGRHIERWDIDKALIKWAIDRQSIVEIKESPMLLAYGKAGTQKGHYELLAALDILATRGRDFSLVLCIGGHRRSLEKLLSTLKESQALSERTTVLPFIPPWRIPSLIASCDAVAFLERDFEISFHGPQVPREVLWSGRALICSKEIVEKQFYSHHLQDKVNYICAGDPRDLSNLTSVLDDVVIDKERLRAIGYRGQLMIRSVVGAEDIGDGVIQALERHGAIESSAQPIIPPDAAR